MVRVCEKCGQPLEKTIVVAGNTLTVPLACECTLKEKEQRLAALKKAEKEASEKAFIRENYSLPELASIRFSDDRYEHSKTSEVMRRYVEKWKEVKEKNIGLLLSGNCGAGKTFYACCIANEVRHRFGEKVLVYTLPRLIKEMDEDFGADWDYWESKLRNYGLVVIDDFGIERSTEYQMEKAQEIIDIRARAGKPLIITTNIPVSEFKEATDIARQRMYSRIIGACTPYTIGGEDKRLVGSRERQAENRKLLGIG